MSAANTCSAQQCPIASAPSAELEDYLNTIQDMITDISRALNSAQSSNQDFDSERQSVLRGLGEAMSFGGYTTSFDFSVGNRMNSELPAPAKRDHELLEREKEKLVTLLKTSEKRGTAGTVIANICNGKQNCNLGENLSVRDILTQLIKNHELLLQLYEATTNGNQQLFSGQNFILIPDTFITDLQSHYGPDALALCSNCDDGYAGRTSDMMKNIGLKTSRIAEAIQQWKDAWMMLVGADTPQMRAETEARVL